MENHILPGGYTYIAITQSFPGAWAKDICPLGAIKRCHNHTESDSRSIINLYYGKDKHMNAGTMGELTFNTQHPPRAIGIYRATSNSIRGLRKSDWSKSARKPYIPLKDWLLEQMNYFKSCKKITSLKENKS